MPYVNQEALFASLRREKVLKSGGRSQVSLVRTQTSNMRCIYRVFAGDGQAYRALLSVQCPYLPKVYAVAEEDGTVRVLEEYIQGDRLDEVLSCGPLSEEQSRSIVQQLCYGLRELHALGVVHRDIKPENVILRGSDAVLIDFDVSRISKADQNADTRVMGTAGYAAPEQYGFHQTDARADIYALGVLFNVMLTGQHPSHQLAEGLYGEVIAKCIEVNADRRYGCVEEILSALQAAEQRDRPVKKRKWGWIVGAAVMLCAVVGGLLQNSNTTEPLPSFTPKPTPTPYFNPIVDVSRDVWGNMVAGYTTPFSYDLDGDGKEEDYVFGVTFEQSRRLYGVVMIGDSVGINPGESVVRYVVPCVWRQGENDELQPEYGFTQLLTDPNTTVRYLWNEEAAEPEVLPYDGYWKGGLKVTFPAGQYGTWLYGVSAELNGEKLTAAATTTVYDMAEYLEYMETAP